MFNLFLITLWSYYLAAQDHRFQIDALRIPLAESVGFSSQGIDALRYDGGAHLAMLNNDDIIVYSLKNGNLPKLEYTVQLKREGPNNVGDDYYEDLTFVSKGEFALYSYWSHDLLKVDASGRYIEKWHTGEWDESKPVLKSAPGMPIVKSGDDYCIGGHLYQTMEKGALSNPIAHIAPSDDEVRYIGRYPEPTYDGAWGLSHISYIDGYKDGSVCVSYSVSDSLQIIDVSSGQIKTVACRSRYIDSPKPISDSYDFDAGANRDRLTRHTLEGKYFRVIYDDVNDLIYRFVLHELPYDEYQRKGYHRFSVIIMNDSFEILDEVKLPKGLFPQYSFLLDDGVYIFDKRHYETHADDYLSFTRLNYCGD